MSIFWTFGTKPKHRVQTPTNCDCVQAGLATESIGEFVDSDRSIGVLVRFGGQKYLDDLVPKLWKQIWDDFKCPPPRESCSIKYPCGATPTKPTYIEIGSAISVDPNDGLEKFRVYVSIARELQCRTGATQPSDVPPGTPKYDEGKEHLRPKPKDGEEIPLPKPKEEE